MKRLHILAIVLLALLVVDEAFGGYKKSKESKKNKKTEGESHEAKRKYIQDEAIKSHKRKARQAIPEEDMNEEVMEEEIQDSYKINKESKKRYKEETKAEKYGKKEKAKRNEELQVTKDRKLEEVGKAYKKSKQEKMKPENSKQKQVIQEEELIELEENGLSGTDDTCAHCHAEPEDSTIENDLEVATIPSKGTPRIRRYIVEEEIMDGDAALDSPESEDLINEEHIPVRKCYYK